jgi:hypothetical protein
MKSNALPIAGAVLVALIGATWYAYRDTGSTTTQAAPTDPWTRLDKSRVDHIIITRPSEPENRRTVDFEKSGTAWRMTAPGRGPTEPRAVEDLLDRLSEMHVAGVAGRNTTSYETFEVDDAHATHVVLKNGSSVLLDLYVGTGVDSGSAVRVPGKTEIYRVDQSIHSMVSRQPRDWRDRTITNVSRDTIQGVEWVNRNGTWRFTRNGDTWTPAAGTTVERLDTAKVNSLVDTISHLNANDFADQGATTGITNDAPRVTITTGGGDAAAGTIVVRLGSNNGDNETFAQREGSDVVFVISRSAGEAVNPALAAFQAPLPTDGGTAADASAAPPAAPPGMPGMPGGPGNMQLPPGVLEQLQRQLQQQQGAH